MLSRIAPVARRALGAVLVLSGVGLAVLLVLPRLLPAAGPAGPAEPISANALADRYRCAAGEIRTVLRGGVEDGYAPGNYEPASPNANPHQLMAGSWQADFDETEQDGNFYYQYILPDAVVGGLLILKFRSLDAETNDILNIGVLDSNLQFDDEAQSYVAYLIDGLSRQPEWEVWDDIHAIDMRDVSNGDFDLLAHLTDAVGGNVLEMSIGDDTSVDFVALVACSAPPPGRGMTFSLFPVSQPLPEGGAIAMASCHPPDNMACDPFVGDTMCETPLPLACYRPGPEPYDPAAIRPRYQRNGRYWIGGAMRLTSPVRGDAFSTIEAANDHCEETFGDGWRVADFHLSGIGFQFMTRSPDGDTGRIWLDIRDQPYATCWSRE